jgi:hypothetical protein
MNSMSYGYCCYEKNCYDYYLSDYYYENYLTRSDWTSYGCYLNDYCSNENLTNENLTNGYLTGKNCYYCVSLNYASYSNGNYYYVNLSVMMNYVNYLNDLTNYDYWI